MSRDLQMRRLHELRDELIDDRIVEAREFGHQWQREAIPGTAGGKALAASPVADPGTPGPPAVTLQRGGPAGEIIHLSGTSDPIASGGDYLTSDAVVDQYGFDSTTPGTDITIPRTATYELDLNLSWDSYLQGGTFEVERNGTVVRTLDAGGLGDGVDWNPTFRASRGDTVKVKVTQTSGSAQTATYTLTVAVMEPTAQKANQSGVIVTLHGHDEPAVRPAQATVNGNADIRVGDLLVAYVASAEPDVTPPTGWTNEALTTSGDVEHRLDYRVAQSGDDSASWTWSATGGVSGDLSLAVTVMVIRAVDTSDPFDGTPGSALDVSGSATSLNPTMTSGSSSSLLLLAAGTGNNDTSHTVSGMTQQVHYNDDSGDMVSTVWSKSAAGGAESETVSWTGGASAGAFLFAMRSR